MEKITLSQEQSDAYFDCIERLNSVLSSINIISLSSSAIEQFDDKSKYQSFADNIQKSCSLVASSLDATISDFLKIIDY